jgi:hypothetical protein
MVVNLVVSPQDLKREKREQSFSIASSRQRNAHPCHYHNIVRSWLDRQAFRFFVPKKKMTASSGEDMTALALALRKDITRTDIYMYNTTFEWLTYF